MTQFIISQIPHYVDREARLKVICDYYDKDWLFHVTAARKSGMYEAMAEVEAENLDEVYSAGNGYGSHSIRKLTALMPSVSIGDLICNTNTGAIYLVAPAGFICLSLGK